MRLLHTSDWHLGHALHDWGREAEHAAFLEWLLELLPAERIDALLVAGDIFDAANPPASAQESWYAFLAAARARCPALEIVVIGGNHDSAARLDAPNPLLSAMGVRMVGGLPRRAGGAVDVARVVVPVHGSGGERALVAAVPFLRPMDLPAVDGEAGDPLVLGVRSVYADVVEQLGRERQAHEPIIAMGHLYMASGELSELSERRILGGNQHALPVDVFPGDVAYVALGHLHRAQRIGQDDRVRYSGSPIPLSMAEASYAHQVVVVELEGAAVKSVRPVLVPHRVEMLRLPARGAAPLQDVLRAIRELPAADATPLAGQPFVELAVLLERPEPTLQHQIQDALADRGVRLVKIGRVLSGSSQPLADALSGRTLEDLTPEQVFVERHLREYKEPPSAELLAAFHELVAQAHAETP